MILLMLRFVSKAEGCGLGGETQTQGMAAVTSNDQTVSDDIYSP